MTRKRFAHAKKASVANQSSIYWESNSLGGTSRTSSRGRILSTGKFCCEEERGILPIDLVKISNDEKRIKDVQIMAVPQLAHKACLRCKARVESVDDTNGRCSKQDCRMLQRRILHWTCARTIMMENRTNSIYGWVTCTK